MPQRETKIPLAGAGPLIPSQQQTFRYTTGPLGANINVAPLRVGVTSAAAPKQAGQLAELLGQAGGLIKTSTDLLLVKRDVARKEGALSALRGDPEAPTGGGFLGALSTASARVDGYMSVKGRADATRFQTLARTFAEEESSSDNPLTLDEFTSKYKQLRDDFIQSGDTRNAAYLESLYPRLDAVTQEVVGSYQGFLTKHVKAKAGEDMATVAYDWAQGLLPEDLLREARKSPAKAARAMSSESFDTGAYAISLREALTLEHAAQSASGGNLSKLEVSEKFVDSVVTLAEELNAPEMLDFTRLPDGGGVALEDTVLGERIRKERLRLELNKPGREERALASEKEEAKTAALALTNAIDSRRLELSGVVSNTMAPKESRVAAQQALYTEAETYRKDIEAKIQSGELDAENADVPLAGVSRMISVASGEDFSEKQTDPRVVDLVTRAVVSPETITEDDLRFAYANAPAAALSDVQQAYQRTREGKTRRGQSALSGYVQDELPARIGDIVEAKVSRLNEDYRAKVAEMGDMFSILGDGVKAEYASRQSELRALGPRLEDIARRAVSEEQRKLLSDSGETRSLTVDEASAVVERAINPYTRENAQEGGSQARRATQGATQPSTGGTPDESLQSAVEALQSGSLKGVATESRSALIGAMTKRVQAAATPEEKQKALMGGVSKIVDPTERREFAEEVMLASSEDVALLPAPKATTTSGRSRGRDMTFRNPLLEAARGVPQAAVETSLDLLQGIYTTTSGALQEIGEGALGIKSGGQRMGDAGEVFFAGFPKGVSQEIVVDEFNRRLLRVFGSPQKLDPNDPMFKSVVNSIASVSYPEFYRNALRKHAAKFAGLDEGTFLRGKVMAEAPIAPLREALQKGSLGNTIREWNAKNKTKKQQ